MADVKDIANTAINSVVDTAQDIGEKARELVDFKPKPLNELNENQYGPNRGEYNILLNYNWTVNGSRLRGKVPYMLLEEYQIDGNLLLTNLNYWTKQITNPNKDNNPYSSLYKAKPTGIKFRFPWLNEYHHQITQNWSDFKGLESTKFGEFLTTVVGIGTNVPGLAINTPKQWKGAGAATIGYEIVLFNTGEPSEIPKNIAKNTKLINRLIMSTLHDQANAILALPPALYTLTIPGVRNSPACIIASLSVENIGTLIFKDKRTVPEAYKIKFSILELISESRQIFDGVNGGKVITAIDSETT